MDLTGFLPEWLPWIAASALGLGVYDLFKKHAVRGNAVAPVIFFATLSGGAVYFLILLCTGAWRESLQCSAGEYALLFVKSLLVSGSWGCVYTAMRDMPVSIVSPVRATSPVWTLLGSVVLFAEIPTVMQGFGMLLVFAGIYFFSVFGKGEGFPWRHRGFALLMLGTLLGASSALFDKYLLNVQKIPPNVVQFYYTLNMILILFGAMIYRHFRKERTPLQWRWSIPLTGIVLAAADFSYFCAVSMPDIQISVLSLVRRCSCVITFAAGVWLFRERNIWRKAGALALILGGVILLVLGK